VAGPGSRPVPRASMSRRYGLQAGGGVELGAVQSGPSPVVGSGRLVKATGPALCSPLNGVDPTKPHGAAFAGLSNQKPTWNVFVGASPTAGSKPKIWSSRIVLIVTLDVPSLFTWTSDWYQARPKFVN